MTQDPRILVVSPIPPELRKRLGGRYELVEYEGPSDGRYPPAPGFQVAVTTSMGGASAQLMAALPDLRLIACNGTGLEYIDLASAQARGVIVQNTPDVLTEDVADFAIGLMFAVTRRIAEGDRFVRAGRWTRKRMTPSRRLSGKTVGIVGLGKVGSAVARRAAGLGMRVVYTDPERSSNTDYGYVSNPADLARRVDILILCCTGGDATRNLVDAEILGCLGPDGYLINVSRGSVVAEADLIDALQSGAIAGAGLDVYASEPDINPAYFSLENVVLEPHYAAVTVETREAMATILENAIQDFLAGKPLASAAVSGHTKTQGMER